MHPHLSSDRSPPAPTAPPGDSAATRAQRRQHENELLDEAIGETFPASDPVSPFIPSRVVERGSTEADSVSEASETAADAASGEDVDALGGVESMAGPAPGIEQASAAAPEQIDPGSEDGQPVI